MEIDGGGVDYSTKFTIFTDGSALNNKAEAPAGMAFFVPSKKILISKSMIATNNQAELEAIRYALWWFKEKLTDEVVPDNTLFVFSDSAYSINAITGKWKKLKENVKKINVCKMLIKQIEETRGVKTVFIHVKAHTRKKDFVSLNNDIVDHEARKKATEQAEGDKEE